MNKVPGEKHWETQAGELTITAVELRNRITELETALHKANENFTKTVEALEKANDTLCQINNDLEVENIELKQDKEAFEAVYRGCKEDITNLTGQVIKLTEDKEAWTKACEGIDELLKKWNVTSVLGFRHKLAIAIRKMLLGAK